MMQGTTLLLLIMPETRDTAELYSKFCVICQICTYDSYITFSEAEITDCDFHVPAPRFVTSSYVVSTLVSDHPILDRYVGGHVVCIYSYISCE